jgi:putative transposase
VRISVDYPPKVAIHRLVGSLKLVSSRRLRQQRPDIRCWKGEVLWSPSYLAASAAAPPDVIQGFIDQQRQSD